MTQRNTKVQGLIESAAKKAGLDEGVVFNRLKEFGWKGKRDMIAFLSVQTVAKILKMLKERVEHGGDPDNPPPQVVLYIPRERKED